MAVRDVDHEDIGAGLDQRLGAVDVVRLDAHRRADEQAALRVQRREGVRRQLHDVRRGNQVAKTAAGVQDGDVVGAGLPHQLPRLLQGDRCVCRGDHAVNRGHEASHAVVAVREKEVRPGEDAEQAPLRRVVDDHQTPHPALAALPVHRREGVGLGGVGDDAARVLDAEGLRALDLPQHRALLGHPAEAVEDPDAPFPRHRDGRLVLADRVHVARKDGNAQGQAAAQPGRGVHPATRANPAVLGNQKHIVVGQTFRQGPRRREARHS
ncbi:unnamed protein product [Phytomonas sp. Hart1]|nr:unnamed protein product [Phytomonas sp. Hart1]|eukprot:CCW70788.1 unnamed protein product [Phytomonas sp. isolate Hart1]